MGRISLGDRDHRAALGVQKHDVVTRLRDDTSDAVELGIVGAGGLRDGEGSATVAMVQFLCVRVESLRRLGDFSRAVQPPLLY